MLGDVLLDKVLVILLDGAAKKLEGYDEKDNTDARASKHALRSNAPASRDEAAVDDVPVPQHLQERVSFWPRPSKNGKASAAYRNFTTASHAHSLMTAGGGRCLSGWHSHCHGAGGHIHVHFEGQKRVMSSQAWLLERSNKRFG